MIRLPIDSFLPEVIESLRGHRNLVLVAEPGAGKTTRVPPAIATSGLLSGEHPALVMLQPRRVAARAAAERIGEERGWRVGEEVGYQVRYERRIGPRTLVRVVTEAILSRQMLTNPELPGIGCVVLDEFHERSIHSDLALALLKEVQGSVREDLRIIVMSATLEAEPVARFLGDARGGCPIIRVPGRVFPVEVSYRPTRGLRVEDAVADAARGALKEEGDVLCFLPGAEEIRRAERALGGVGEADVLPLHGTLPFEMQRRAIAPSPTGRRKIILATNIAETSLTIDGVRTVVDSGLSRQTSFDAARGLEKLALGRISQASATQRAGRAGRTAEGRCVRLWSAMEQNELRAFDAPELHRTDLASTLLTLLAWGVRDVGSFGWFERPPAETAAAALSLLGRLGAMEREGRISALGQRMAALPLHPRLARLLIDSVDSGRAAEGAALAALLSERDFRLRDRAARYGDRRPSEIAESDLTPRVEMLEHAVRRGFHPSLEGEDIDPVGARAVTQTRDELLRRAREVKPVAREVAEDLVIGAYPDRVCLRRGGVGGEGTTGLMVGGVGVTLAPESAVRRGELFLALDARDDDRTERKQASVALAHAVTADDLRRAFPGAFVRRVTCVYDAEKDKVVGRVQVMYEDLVLEEKDDARVEEEAAAAALAEAIGPTLHERIARDDKAANLAARIALAAKYVPVKDGAEGWPMPPWTSYPEALRRALRGRRKLGEFSAVAFLEALLPWPLDRLLDEHVPERWTVPTGNKIAIDYRASPPVLAVRLQEMFGARQTPSVAGGRLALTLHLLSPGYKPVQVTQDLVSFWTNTYAQVRKDLRARYPKHSWPEDPWEAEPVARGRSTKR